ncbi:galactokinase [Aggregatilinea lenta]|uniref:galactokinase n=1 Tax=Aggregatilinea lenta TaxID=913108 RepID=UPI000E5B76BE|nr:galactokinase [Aggregatilinea lenta]
MDEYDYTARKDTVAQAFAERFGAAPALWARAPGRVDLMGSHTDYNLGYVMTATVDRDTWIAARPRADRQVRIGSLNVASSAAFSLDMIEHDDDAPWTNYVRGVAVALQEAGYALRGFDGLVHSTVPFSSGLSSSAAIEMAAAVVFAAVSGFDLDPVQMALIGQRAENHFVGVNSGILDQYSSALGQSGSALLLDCRTLTHRAVPLNPSLQMVICDTRAARNLTGTEYDERRAQCEHGVRLLQRAYPAIEALRDVSLEQLAAHCDALPEVVARRCRFIIEENRRVLDLARALPVGDRVRLAKLYADSYAGARDLYEIGAPSMAAMMDAMLAAPGVIGARQAGAGFGGCMIALVECEQVVAFSAAVERTYAAGTGIQPRVFPVTASDGAGLLAF